VASDVLAVVLAVLDAVVVVPAPPVPESSLPQPVDRAANETDAATNAKKCFDLMCPPIGRAKNV
jgi:hypothetical protein